MGETPGEGFPQTPGEGFPQTPFLRLMSKKNFARCGGRAGAPPPGGAPIFFKKPGEKNLKHFILLGGCI